MQIFQTISLLLLTAEAQDQVNFESNEVTGPCASGQTLCTDGTQEGCCPLPNAVCCPTFGKCCPENTTCVAGDKCQPTTEFGQIPTELVMEVPVAVETASVFT